MIEIVEEKSVGLPTDTSLFVTLSFYNQNIFETLVQMEDSIYDDKLKRFEIPLNRLSFLITFLRKYDDTKFVPFRASQNCAMSFNDFKFKVKPFSHQMDAVNYGANRESGWMLLDDTGLGKTGTIIYLSDVLKHKEGLEHCFIICGVNSLKYNWASEIGKFSDLSYRILGQKVSKRGKVSIGTVQERLDELKSGIDEFFVITNIETLQHKDFAKYFNKSKSKFDMIVMDEAHRCKNPSSQSAKTLIKLKAKRCIALTGTVIINNPENAFLPLKWTGNVSTTFSKFKGMYNRYGGFGGVQVIGHKNLDLLQDLLSTCSLRRLKTDVLDLPDQTFITEYVDLYNDQRKLYDEVSDGVLTELNKLDHKPSIIEEITINMRLRQITAYPGILSTEVTRSAKIDRLVELCDDIVAQGDKVVVYSTFKESAKKVFEELSEHYGVVLCTGDDSDDVVERKKSYFKTDSSCKVLVCTWQKMGTGHTLTEANYAIFLDTPWTYADFKQSYDRIYRIGQNKKVFVITIIAKDTYDERVQEIINNKNELSSYVVDNKAIGKFENFPN